MPILYPLSTSPEKAVAAKKYPTKVVIHLQYTGTVSSIPSGTMFFVGDAIKIRGYLVREVAPGDWRLVPGTKPLKFYHKVDTGVYTLIKTVNHVYAAPTLTYADIDPYTLTKPGTHTFKIEFAGDAEHEGCKKAAETFAR